MIDFLAFPTAAQVRHVAVVVTFTNKRHARQFANGADRRGFAASIADDGYGVRVHGARFELKSEPLSVKLNPLHGKERT